MTFKVISCFVISWGCFLTCTPFLVAQSNFNVSKRYFMTDGLPSEGISAVIQDKKGFIWLATFSGLTRFDGYKFTTYTHNPLSSNSLRNKQIGDVFEDNNGRLWIAHAEGLDVFDPQTESFLFHWPSSGDTIIGVGRFRQQKDGKVWICSSDGLYLGDAETFSVTKFTAIPISHHIMDVAEMNDGSVWAAGHNIYSLQMGSSDYITYEHLKNGPKNITIDKHNRIWIGSPDGLELFDPVNKTFTKYLVNRFPRDVKETPDGNLLVVSDSLILFNPVTGKKSSLPIPPSNKIKAMVDRQGTIWIATFFGLEKINSIHNKFHIYQQHGVGAILEDTQGNIWVNHYNGYSILNGNNFQFSPYPSEVRLGSLFLDNDQNVWRGYLGGILEMVNPAGKTLKTIKAPLDVNVYNVLVDSRGSIWFANYSGIMMFDPTTGKTEPPGFHHSLAYCFLEDSAQNIWIGTPVGLIKYNLNTKSYEIFKNIPGDPESLSNNVVYNLTKTRDGTIWIGTAGGVNKLKGYTVKGIPKFTTWQSASSGLPNDDVYSIVDGGDGTLWMTCGNKISHFYPEQNIFRNYDESDGLSGQSFRGIDYLSGKGIRARDGRIYFGSLGGLVIFHPDSMEDNSYVPPIVITNFSVRNEVMPVKGTSADTLKEGTPLEKLITYTDHIKLAYDQNDFNLEFASLNYRSPQRNQYKYKLEPYQKEWIITTADNRVAQYTNLNPGTYTFRVIGSNNDGIWNEQGATLTIVITPPWWKTWWAYTLYGLAVLGIFLYWRRYENKRLKLKHRAEHLSELDHLKTQFFTNISHEFRTPITLIQSPLKEMYQGTFKGDQRSVIGVMLRNAQRLSKLINQLLDLSKLEDGKMTLRASSVELVQFLREIVASYESLAASKNIKYFFYPEVAEVIAYIDAEKIEKVVHNLLSNAFKFTKDGGEVILSLKSEEKQCSIAVKDTGIGIPAVQLDKIFDRFYQVDSSQTRGYEGSGLGMAVAKDLVELHHGTIAVESVEGRGTTFTVRLPLGKKHFTKDQIMDEPHLKKSETYPEDLIVMNDNHEPESEKTIEPDHQPILLIVEDNEDMRRYIRKTFADLYQIIEAGNGKEGIVKAREVIPDIIISDVMMPEMDGYKFCEHIKSNELTSHVPVILLTAKADHQSKLTGLETGADDYLAKPFDADELKLIVRNRIEQRKKIRERFSREITLEPKQIAITSFDEKFLNKVLAIIESHMDDESFSIEELSREAGYSNMHFYRKIKALAGETPSQFLRTIRLKRAAELLRAKSDNVTQIAYSVGFNNLSYFSKCFKEQFGVTPGQYAQQDIQT